MIRIEITKEERETVPHLQTLIMQKFAEKGIVIKKASGPRHLNVNKGTPGTFTKEYDAETGTTYYDWNE